MKRWYLLFVILLSIGFQSAHAQKESKRQQKKVVREAQQNDQNNKAKLDAGLSDARGKHRDIQTKDTKKRMKKNARKQKKLSTGKSVPFYKRWFRKRRFK